MKKEVLLVDDDSIINFINVAMLKHVGISEGVHIANNGVEALDLINGYFIGQRSLPNVILLDLNMPVMDGFAFIEAFQRIQVPGKQHVQIVVLTSSNSPVDMDRAMKLGVRNYLVKPISEADLLKVLSVSGVDFVPPAPI
jgi:CheY-like chemotaxis protein